MGVCVTLHFLVCHIEVKLRGHKWRRSFDFITVSSSLLVLILFRKTNMQRWRRGDTSNFDQPPPPILSPAFSLGVRFSSLLLTARVAIPSVCAHSEPLPQCSRTQTNQRGSGRDKLQSPESHTVHLTQQSSDSVRLRTGLEPDCDRTRALTCPPPHSQLLWVRCQASDKRG